MKGLKGLASVMVLLGLTVCAPRANAEIKLKQYKSPVQSEIKPNQSVENNQNINSKLEQGFKFFKAEKYREAISIFNQIIQVEPNNPYAYFGRGASYFGLNDYQKAKTDLDKSISIDSSLSYAYLFRGLSNYGLGSKQEAISDLQTAANMFEKEGEKEMAQKSLDTIEKIRNA
jgi:tetratricopeptide (TPR) repeat protein